MRRIDSFSVCPHDSGPQAEMIRFTRLPGETIGAHSRKYKDQNGHEIKGKSIWRRVGTIRFKVELSLHRQGQGSQEQHQERRTGA